MSSDSENERSIGYEPVLAQKLNMPRGNSARVGSPSMQRAGSTSNSQWPRDAVSLYSNELFTDGDVLAAPAPQHDPYGRNAASSPSTPTGAKAQQRSTLASRRAERMASSIYEANSDAKSTIFSKANGSVGGGEATSTMSTASMQRTGSGLTPRAGGVNNAFGKPPALSLLQRNGSAMASPGGSNYGYDDISETGTPMVHGLPSTYDPNEGEDQIGPFTNSNQQSRLGQQQQQTPTQRGGQQQQPAYIPQQPRIDTSDIRSFLMTPGPKMGPVLCYIERDKGSAKMYPKYNLYLQDGQQFLLAARKRKKATTSNYVLSLDYDDLGRESENLFGKLRANFVGTEFTIFDGGEKAGLKKKAPSTPKASSGNGRRSPDSGDGSGGETAGRQEYAGVLYQYNVLGTRGPRKMTAVIPAIDALGRSMYTPKSADDTLLERSKSGKGLNELVVMKNKPPRWNDELSAYCLNFNGRVTEASVKNFQLVSEDNLNHTILQFGKVGKDRFTMDYQWPITPFQAFSICLSSFDNKLACE